MRENCTYGSISRSPVGEKPRSGTAGPGTRCNHQQDLFLRPRVRAAAKSECDGERHAHDKAVAVRMGAGGFVGFRGIARMRIEEVVVVGGVRAERDAIRDVPRELALDAGVHHARTAKALRLVISDLAEITGQGQITPNEILGNIFQHFCVGK